MSSAPIVRGNYKRYTLEQKQRAVQLGVEYSFGHASDLLKIPKSTIMTWKKKFDDCKVEVEKKTGRNLTYDVQTDLAIQDWVLGQRELNLPLSRADLAQYAKEKIDQPSLKATDGWIRHFMRRHNLSLRSRTKVAKKTPTDDQNRIDIFHRHIETIALDTDFVHVINMDETPSFGDLPPTRTISSKGEKEVAIRTTGAEKRRYTIALTITLSGATLAPLVIFKGKRWPSDVHSVPTGVFMEMQENAWMNENIMLIWIENILAPFTAHAPSLLILDAFSGHTTPAVMDKLAELNRTPIQPLDVSINKPFKDRLRTLHSHYLRNTDVDAHGRTPKASRQDLLGFVKSAWESISSKKSKVAESFSGCGITQAFSRAVQERERKRDVLDKALASDDSDEEFFGFSECNIPHAFLDEDNPFL